VTERGAGVGGSHGAPAWAGKSSLQTYLYAIMSTSRGSRSKAKSVSDGASEESESDSQIILRKLDENKASADKQYSNLMSEITRIIYRLDAVESEQKQYVECLDFVSKEVSDMKGEIHSLKKTVAELMESAHNRITRDEKVAKSVDKIENEKNRKVLLLANIPVSPNENLAKVLTTLCKHLETNLKPTDIESVYRIKTAKSPDPPLIMAKFHDADLRDKVYSARKLFVKKSINTTTLGFNTESNIYINEVLSKAQQSLFYMARKKKKDLHWRYVWTFHGQVYMRETNNSEPIKVVSDETLRNLSPTPKPR